MQVDAGTGSTAEVVDALMGRHGSDHARQDVAHAAAGHAGIARRIEVNIACLGRNDERRRTFENEIYLPFTDELPGRANEVALDVAQGKAAEAGKFRQMRRDDEALAKGREEILFPGQKVECIGVQDERAGDSRNDFFQESFRFVAAAHTGTHGQDGPFQIFCVGNDFLGISGREMVARTDTTDHDF